MTYYPNLRMRRLRADDFSRRLIRETSLSCDDLIYPIFVTEGDNQRQAVSSLPGIERFSIDLLVEEAQRVHQLGIPAIALFPTVSDDKRTSTANEAFNPEGLIQRAVRSLKQNLPQLGVITDVALDPFTSDGQDGLSDESGYVMNDETVQVLVHQALSHIEAGADIVAPSDMMDGRVGVIRDAFEHKGYVNAKILAYSVKYASHFYQPFRSAVGSQTALGESTKETYQMDICNAQEALREAQLDLDEGADILMVKPATMYLDIVAKLKDTFNVPVFAYHVSGEYAMLKASAVAGHIDEKQCVLETLKCIKRAGASAILSYYAVDAARWLRDGE